MHVSLNSQDSTDVLTVRITLNAVVEGKKEKNGNLLRPPFHIKISKPNLYNRYKNDPFVFQRVYFTHTCPIINSPFLYYHRLSYRHRS
jgi:hypothetical protein